MIDMIFGALVTVYVAWYSLKKGRNDLEQATLELQRTSRQAIQNMTDGLQTELRNIEDSTRRLLKGFPDVFLKAKEMLERLDVHSVSPQLLWILNFTPSFGHIYSFNSNIVGNSKKTGRSHGDTSSSNELRLKAKAFGATIGSLAKTVSDFKVATVKPEEFLDVFVRPMLSKFPPEAWLSDFTQIETELLQEHTAATSTIKLACGNNSEKMMWINKIPFQMFIVGRAGKEACLVFFIGTDNLKREHRVRGFYTEFSDLVELFKEIFDGIVGHGGGALCAPFGGIVDQAEALAGDERLH